MRVIINPCFGSKRSRSPFTEGYDRRRSTAVCNFLNRRGVLSAHPLASGRNILPTWFARDRIPFHRHSTQIFIVRNWSAVAHSSLYIFMVCRSRKKLLPPEIETTTAARRNFIPSGISYAPPRTLSSLAEKTARRGGASASLAMATHRPRGAVACAGCQRCPARPRPGRPDTPATLVGESREIDVVRRRRTSHARRSP